MCILLPAFVNATRAFLVMSLLPQGGCILAVLIGIFKKSYSVSKRLAGVLSGISGTSINTNIYRLIQSFMACLCLCLLFVYLFPKTHYIRSSTEKWGFYTQLIHKDIKLSQMIRLPMIQMTFLINVLTLSFVVVINISHIHLLQKQLVSLNLAQSIWRLLKCNGPPSFTGI